jgi:signal transduction histidine kinase/PAS domain-containing protein
VEISIRRAGLLPVLGLALSIGTMFLFNLGEGPVFVSPDLLLALNTLFLTGSGALISVISARSYLKDGSTSLLLLGMATAAGGAAAAIAGWAAGISVNDNVGIFNSGFLISGGLQLLSAVVTTTGATSFEPKNRRTILALGYLGAVGSVAVVSALIFLGLSPQFYGPAGMTLTRQWVIFTVTLFFASSAAMFALHYSRSKSPVIYWYTLALVLMAISMFGLATYTKPNALFNWIARVAYYGAGLYFLAGLLRAKGTLGFWGEASDSLPEKWADAFRNDPRLLDTLFGRMTDGFAMHRIVCDSNGKPIDYVYLDVNAAYEEMTGLIKEDIIGKRVTEVLPGIERDKVDWIGVYGHVALTESSTRFQSRSELLHKWFSIYSYSPRRGYFVSLSHDITVEKNAEERAAWLATFPALNPNPIMELDYEGNVIYANDAARSEISGFDELASRHALFSDWDNVVRFLMGEPAKHLVREEKVGEHWLHREFHILPEQRHVRVYTTIIDDLKSAEDELRKSEAFARSQASYLQAILDHAPAVIWIANDRYCREIVGNRTAEELLRVPPGSNISKSSDSEMAKHHRIVKDGVELSTDQLPTQRVAFTGMAISDFDFDLVLEDGELHSLTGGCVPLFDEAGEPAGAVSTFVDVTERRLAEAKVVRQREVQEGISQILQAALSQRTEEELGEVCLAVAEKVTESRIGFLGEIKEGKLHDIAISERAWEACQMKDPTGHKADLEAFEIVGIPGKVLRDGAGLFTNSPSSHPDSVGTPIGHPTLNSFLGVPLKSNGTTIGMIAVANREGGYSAETQELLESLSPAVVAALMRKRAERRLEEYSKELERLVEERTKELQDSSRWAAIGQTAGMVGHDIRNPLQVIIGEAYLAVNGLKALPSGKARKSLEESLRSIGASADYINKIIRDLQDFSRKLKPSSARTDLQSLMEQVLAGLDVPSSIKAAVRVEKAARSVVVDPELLKRILDNLVSNAIQAMPSGGEVTLGAHVDGPELVVSVRDTGVGIPDEARPKIFQPLFTTKSKGQGFGLAVVKRMTEALGGTVTFDSTVGKGTVFLVRLPAGRDGPQEQS